MKRKEQKQQILRNESLDKISKISQQLPPVRLQKIHRPQKVAYKTVHRVSKVYSYLPVFSEMNFLVLDI